MRQIDLGLIRPARAAPSRAAPRRAATPQLGLFAEREVPPPSTLEVELGGDAEDTDEVMALEPDAPRGGIRGQARIEGFLRKLIGPKVMVQLTRNRSTMISYSTRKGVIYLRLHEIFSEAPEHVLGAVARFVTHKRACPKSTWLIDQWIESHRHLVKRGGKRPPPLPRGEVHDLKEIYDELNVRYFQNRVTSAITWSTAAKKQKRSSIRLGSYSEDEKLIRIHPALDQSFVPRLFVSSVVFHEMLHELHGAHEVGGMRRVHTPAFRRDEAKFEGFAEARAWEAQNLHRLLRY